MRTKTQIAELLAVLLLIVLLTSCGTQNQAINSSNTTLTSSTTPTSSTSTLSDNLSPNKTGVSVDRDNLHIDASDGIQCPSGAITQGQPDNPGPLVNAVGANNLVLATDRLTYDANELQQMRDYLNTFRSGSAQIPHTLRWVLGGPTDTGRILNIDGKASGYIYDCGFKLELTNTGQDSIQISSVGAQLTADTQQNTYQYRLIDQCTLTQCQFGAGPSSCSQYFATIKLGTGSINTVFSATPSGRDTSCGEFTLNPGDAKSLYVYIYSSQNLIYSVVPQLVLSTSSGPNTLTLTDLTSTLAFANGSQFTCYGLQGDTFVAETSPPPTSLCI